MGKQTDPNVAELCSLSRWPTRGKRHQNSPGRKSLFLTLLIPQYCSLFPLLFQKLASLSSFRKLSGWPSHLCLSLCLQLHRAATDTACPHETSLPLVGTSWSSWSFQKSLDSLRVGPECPPLRLSLSHLARCSPIPGFLSSPPTRGSYNLQGTWNRNPNI